MRALHWLSSILLLFASAAWAQTQFPTVSWPPSPAVKIAVNPVTNKTYLVNEAANTVTVLDATDGTSKTIPVGPRPYYIAVNPTTNRVYVNTANDSSVSVIDGATDAVIAALPIGSVGPIQINPITNVVYIVRLTGPGTDEITFIDGATHSYYSIATESYQPISVAVNPVTNRIYIAHYATGDVRVISGAMDGNAHPSTVSIGVWQRPFAIAANPMTNKVYAITEDSRGPIAIIDGATNVAQFPAISAGHAVGPKAIAVNTVTNKVYTAFNDEIIVVDGITNALAYVPIGATGTGPVEIAIDTATNKVYVAKDNGQLAVIDGLTNAVLATLPIPQGVNSIGVNPIDNTVYVFGETAAVLDGISAPAQPIPLTTSIAIAGNSGGNATFTLQAASGFGPSRMPITGVYYQLDSTQGAWTRAAGAGPYTVSLSGLAPGSYTLHAFATDGQDAPLHTASQSAPLVGSIASLSFTVGAPALATPSVTLAASLNPSTAGESITFTATVSGSADTPAGTVDFRDGAGIIPGCGGVLLAGGIASCTTSSLAAGQHTIAAAYSGSSAYAPATSGTITQTVNAPKSDGAEMIYPADGSTLMGRFQLLDWAGIKGATYTLWVGTTPGGRQLGTYNTGRLSAWLLWNLPTDGRRIYVRLITKIGNATGQRDYTYTADSKNAAEMKTPTTLKRFKSTTQSFKWDGPKGAQYELLAGRTLGGGDLGTYAGRNASATIRNLPSDGSWVYVRLRWTLNGVTQFRDYAYLTYQRGKERDNDDHERWGDTGDDDGGKKGKGRG